MGPTPRSVVSGLTALALADRELVVLGSSRGLAVVSFWSATGGEERSSGGFASEKIREKTSKRGHVRENLYRAVVIQKK